MAAAPRETGTAPAPGRPARVRTAWIRRGVLAGVLLLALGSVATVIRRPRAASEPRATLIHTVRRGGLTVTITERGTLESSSNIEIKCKVRGRNTITWVIENGSVVNPGDKLLTLDTLSIEEQIDERSKYAHWSRSGAESWRAQVASAKLAIPEYLEGRYVVQLKTLEKDLAIAESNLRIARSILDHARMMYERGYRSEIDVEQAGFAVERATLDVGVKKTQIDVLKNYTRAMELERLKGELAAAEAEFAASDERARADAARRDRAIEELEHCVVRAERAGMVSYPRAEPWKRAPEIEEGATVHKDQVLLLMPDLTKMQVKIGVHEAIVDRIKPGLHARVTLPDRTLDAEVDSVSAVARPAGWWTGNVVKYDTIVKLPAVEGLKPGMSAEVEVTIARYDDVLTVPVAAVLDTGEGAFCWAQTADGPQRRVLKLGDTNDRSVIVESGLEEGDEVILNPLAFIPEARRAALDEQGETDAAGTERGEARAAGGKADAGPARPPESASGKGSSP